MLTRRGALDASSFAEFGTLLRVLRLRARLTQRELGLAVGYSEAQISRLEQAKRQPDPSVVAALFLPALRLSAEPELAARLHELALAAAGQARQPPGPARRAPSQASQQPDGRGGAGDPEDLAAIPAPPSHHVERAGALAELRGRLAAEQRLLVCGLPGTGKTALAAGLARQLAGGQPVCWMTLTAGITTPAEAIIRQLARFLSRHGHSKVDPLCQQGGIERSLPLHEQLYLITTAMNRAGALICIDNAHLLRAEPAGRTVIEHVAGSAVVTMLALSREDMPLAAFTPHRLGGLTRAEARALTAELAGPVLTAPLADTLIERTGGSPMLIRLALGQLRPGGPGAAALIDRLEAEPGISGYLLQSTLGELSDAARRLVSIVAVFRRPVDLLDGRLIDASEALGGRYDVLAGLDELRRRQLVDHPARAELHPLVRDHVYAGLLGAAAGRAELHQLAARHCAQALADPLEASWHYAQAGRGAQAAELLSGRVAELMAGGRCGRAADQAGELLAAGDLPEQTRRQLLIARGDLLLHTERAGEAEASYRAALARPARPAARAEVGWRLAQSLLQRGKVPEALELCQATAAGLTGPEEVLRAQLAAVQSRAHMMLSQIDQAASVAGQACAAADRIADIAPGVAAAVRARACWVLGVTARLRDRPQEAESWLRQAAESASAAGLPEVAGRALFNIGAIAFELGQASRAEELYAEALARMRPIGDGYGIARVLHALGVQRAQSGQPEEAMRLLDEARALKLRLGDPLGAANSEHSQALILLHQGRTAAAAQLLTSIISATSELGDRHSRPRYYDSLAMVSLADGDTQTAQRCLAEAEALNGPHGSPSLRGLIQVHRGLALLAAGDLAGARQLADSCAPLLTAAGAHADLSAEHAGLTACVALADDDQAAAAAAAALMGSLADRTGNARHREAAEQLAALAAAQEPGGSRDLASLPRLLWVGAPAQPA
ncbi:MAG TPA: helix-turn-helix domain-containing protein [Streptosporangiaceae bacterium]|jgi:ATP/maltotriose-dependent transcriptional regulator MalT/transcriptional regulator with XRE-family HTH domain